MYDPDILKQLQHMYAAQSLVSCGGLTFEVPRCSTGISLILPHADLYIFKGLIITFRFCVYFCLFNL